MEILEFTNIRWMIRRDMPKVLDIENESFDNPWKEEDFIRCLRQRNCIGVVAECDNEIIGFSIYELHPNKLILVNLAVAKKHRRIGVGSLMIQRLKSKLSQERRSKNVDNT